jgi:ribose transport system substrate-binding protein
MTRKSGAASIAALLALAVAGCSSASDEETATPGGGNGGGDGGGDYQLAFIQGVAGDEFYISMECGIREKAEELGATVEVQGPQKFDPSLQTPILDSVVSSGPDAILIAPTDITAMERPIQNAADAGIEIVLVDTTLENPDMAASQIASDNIGGGAAAFDAIKEQKPEGGKVLVVGTDPGISTLDARVQGFEEAVAGDSNFEYLGVEYSHNEPAEAAQIVTSALQANPDIVGIFAANLFSAEGSATGLRQADRDDIVLVGFDAGPAQVEALEAGTVQALIAQKPYDIGVQGVEQAIAALEGEQVEEKIQTDFVIVTQDNMDDPEVSQYLYRSEC